MSFSVNTAGCSTGAHYRLFIQGCAFRVKLRDADGLTRIACLCPIRAQTAVSTWSRRRNRSSKDRFFVGSGSSHLTEWSISKVGPAMPNYRIAPLIPRVVNERLITNHSSSG